MCQQYQRGLSCSSFLLQDNRWGPHAQSIVNGTMWQQPRNGGHDDKAHPPIHPVKYSPGAFCSGQFLAVCGARRCSPHCGLRILHILKLGRVSKAVAHPGAQNALNTVCCSTAQKWKERNVWLGMCHFRSSQMEELVFLGYKTASYKSTASWHAGLKVSYNIV
jgi:hypothetical protein